MRATLGRCWRVIALAMTTALLAIGATTTMVATAAAPATVPPINDNYLDALNLNEPPTPHHPARR